MDSGYRGATKLVLFDVDGVLTDGKLHISAQGELFKSFNAKDGVAVSLLRSHGILSGIVSGKSSPSLDFRSKQLSFDHSITGCRDKLIAVQNLCETLSIKPESVVFVGDDIMDLSVMKFCGSSYAPSDAHILVKRTADYLTTAKGGDGVAREVAEHILYSGGLSIEEAYSFLTNKWESHHVQQ